MSLTEADGRDHEWLSYNGDLANHRYAAQDQINTRNIAQLGAIWVSEPFAESATSRMTPLVHNGRMFLAAGARIYALDARTGKVLWNHQTETRKTTGNSAFSGLAVTHSWGLGLGGGMIFAGLMNDHLIALRERTGEQVWDAFIPPEPLPVSQGITSPPLYAHGMLYFGLGSEFSMGRAVAVEARSGRVLWRTPTVAQPGQSGHESWPKDSEIWRSGGAAPWAAPAVDVALGLVYFVTGNPGPGTGGKVRLGDNLYSVSLIALERKTGKLRWYRQLVHHDLWEMDLSVPPVLFDQKIGDQTRRVVGVMRADGYLFAFDRATGEQLIPIEDRPMPQNPARLTAATQPFPRGADSILNAYESWRKQIPTGFVLGCLFDPPSAETPNELRPYADVRVAPMSYSPQTGYFYAQGTNALVWLGTGEDPYVLPTTPFGERIPNYPAPTVVLAAIDSRMGKVIWRKTLPSYDDSGYKSNGGSLSTAGNLVFHQGGDGTLQAYNARTGETLWRFQTDFAVGDASPMSYTLEGKQYIAFVAGSKVWAFAIGGTLAQAASIPPPVQEAIKGPIEDTSQIETLSLEQGQGNGHRYRLNEYAFKPYRARVRAGTPLTFINNGYLPHTIVASDGSWTTGTLSPTQVATLVFDKPGSYLYFSKEYPWSYGQLIVTSGEGSAGTSEQVNLGKSAYAASCAVCHGESLGGRDPAPALVGHGFAGRWAGRDALELFERIRTTMPQSAPGSLSDESYVAIVSYILYSNDASVPVNLGRQGMKGLAVVRGQSVH